MIMRWCNIQTYEYDPQAKMYPNICTHHKLHNNDENKIPIFPGCIWINDRIWCNKHLKHTTTEIDNNGKGGYFRFDDDNNMGYRYILSITSTEMGTQPRKTVITMGKLDTSDLMMIITWAIDISCQSPKLKWASWTHAIYCNDDKGLSKGLAAC